MNNQETPSIKQQEIATVMQSLQKMLVQQQSSGNEETQERDRPALKVFSPPQPDVFRGKREARAVENWIYLVQKYYELTGVEDDRTKILLAVLLLRDTALAWWRYLETAKGAVIPTTWNDFCTAFRQEFKPKNPTKLARDGLLRLKQTSTVTKYIDQFRDVVYDIPNIQTEEALYTFTSGLKEHIRRLVLLQQPKTLRQAYELAELIESAHQNC